MKKAFLYAYEKMNLGDDLFIEYIAKRYPNTKFYLWTDKYNKITFQDLDNLIIIDKDSKFFSMVKKLRESLIMRIRYFLEKRCDISVYIGGSIFIEYDSWKEMLNWWEYEASTFPFYVIGANFGPYKTEEYKNRLNRIFTKMQDVCFRDKYSFELFQKNSKVRCAADILFGMDIKKKPVKEKQVFVSLIDFKGKIECTANSSENYYEQMIAELISKYIQDNCSVILSSFCKIEGDEKVAYTIMQYLSENEQKKCKLLFYDGTNRKEILGTIAESAYIIGSRFHSIILGLVAGKPVFPIIYSDKTTNMLNDIGFNGNMYDLRWNKSCSYEYSRKNWDDLYSVSIQELKQSSQEHFMKLDKVLNV